MEQDISVFVGLGQVIAATLATVYGVTLLFTLPRSSIWPYLAGAVTLFTIDVAATLEYPLVAIWPAFAAVLLVIACIGGLVEHTQKMDLLPLTHCSLELWIVLLLGIGLICWAVRTTRNFMQREQHGAQNSR